MFCRITIRDCKRKKTSYKIKPTVYIQLFQSQVFEIQFLLRFAALMVLVGFYFYRTWTFSSNTLVSDICSTITGTRPDPLCPFPGNNDGGDNAVPVVVSYHHHRLSPPGPAWSGQWVHLTMPKAVYLFFSFTFLTIFVARSSVKIKILVVSPMSQ